MGPNLNTILITKRFYLYSHNIIRSKQLGGLSRQIIEAWFHSENIPRAVCTVTLFYNYVDWIHTDEQYRRQGIASEVLHAIEKVIPNLILEGETTEGIAFCKHYEENNAKSSS